MRRWLPLARSIPNEDVGSSSEPSERGPATGPRQKARCSGSRREPAHTMPSPERREEQRETQSGVQGLPRHARVEPDQGHEQRRDAAGTAKEKVDVELPPLDRVGGSAATDENPIRTPAFQ